MEFSMVLQPYGLAQGHEKISVHKDHSLTCGLASLVHLVSHGTASHEAPWCSATRCSAKC